MARRATHQSEITRSPAVSFLASENMGADAVVYMSNSSEVSLADSSTGFGAVVGLTRTSILEGLSVVITTSGLHSLSSALNGGTTGDPVYFTDSGALTLTAPSDPGDYVQQIGIYNTSTSIFVQISPPLGL